MDEAHGQLTFRRAVSKSLVFFDLRLDCGDSWLELVLKDGVYSGSVRDARDALKLGDVVAVTGHREDGGHAIQAVAVSIARAWREQHPGQPFVPQPSPLRRQQHQQHATATAAHSSSSQSKLAAGSSTGAPGIAAAPAGNVGTSEAAAAAAVAAVAAASAAPAPAASPSAVLQAPRLALCKFWTNSGRCAKGVACPFAHLQTGALPAARAQWISSMRGQRAVLSAAQGFVHDASASAKRLRARLLAQFLVDTFGRQTLNAGAGVLDVAGGAGGLSFELAVAHGISVTLIDPRPLKLNKQQHRALREAGLALQLETWTHQQLQQQAQQQHAEAGDGVQQQQRQLEPAVVQLLGGQMEQQHQEQQHSEQRQQPQRLAVRLRQLQAWFGEELWGCAAWRHLCGACSLVVGLHPDQATEHILQYALAAGKPFALVPCCVFPRLFPHRRLLAAAAGAVGDGRGSGSGGPVISAPGGPQVQQLKEQQQQQRQQQQQHEGQAVVSYAQLVSYVLQQGGPGARSAVLGFDRRQHDSVSGVSGDESGVSGHDGCLVHNPGVCPMPRVLLLERQLLTEWQRGMAAWEPMSGRTCSLQ